MALKHLNQNNLGWIVALILVAFVSSNQAAATHTPGISMARTFHEGAPGSSAFIIDFTSDPMIDALHRAGRLFEDNIFSKVPVKFVYSSKTNRVYSQAGVSYQEDDDPVDNSSTRTPPKGRDGRYLTPGLAPWTLISQYGARAHGPNGAQHYGAGIQFHALKMEDGTVAMCLSTAPGMNSGTRYSGFNRNGEHLVCQVLIMPNGDTVFGYNTDPNYAPKIMFQGQPYFNTQLPLKWFSGDAWPHIAPPTQENEGRRDMRVRMFEKID